MTEDDDWFESAVGEDEETDRSDPDEASDAAASGDETEQGGRANDEDDDGGDVAGDGEPAADPDGPGDSEEGPADLGDGSSDGPADEEDRGAFGGEPDFGDGDGGDADDLFGDEPSFDDGAGGDDPFGESGGGSGEDLFDDSGGDDGGLFDDDFASAFENAPGPGGDSGFEDEDFESEIPRIDLGIAGLDGMIQGGVPERHLVVTIGSAGTGKTTFGLQFLNHGLEQGESAVFITLEQSHDAIIATAAEHGWDFAGYEEEGKLAVVDMDPIEMANSLDNIRAELPQLIEDFGADRLVLDSVSLLEMMYDQQARRRTEVFDFTRSLKRAGVTTMLTSEASEANAYASRHGIIEYLTDAVIVLQYVRAETQETRLAVEIQKIRDANHSRETKPYEIETGGISVYQQANIF